METRSNRSRGLSRKLPRTTRDRYPIRDCPRRLLLLPGSNSESHARAVPRQSRQDYGIVGGDVFDEMCFRADDCGVPRPSEEQAYRVETVTDAIELMASLKLSAAGPATGAESVPTIKD